MIFAIRDPMAKKIVYNISFLNSTLIKIEKLLYIKNIDIDSIRYVI